MKEKVIPFFYLLHIQFGKYNSSFRLAVIITHAAPILSPIPILSPLFWAQLNMLAQQHA